MVRTPKETYRFENGCHEMKIAIHTKIDHKPLPEEKKKWESLATEFVDADLSIDELAEHINQGHSFCAQHDGRRASKNFYACEFLAADIDDGMTLPEGLENEFIKNHAAIVYATQNHSPEHNRFRVVFALTRTIQDAEEMKHAYQGIIRKFGGDQACKDACRFFFGSKNHTPIVLGNMLPETLLDEIIALGKKKKTKAEPNRMSEKFSATRSETGLSDSATVVTSAGNTCLISDLPSHTSVHCPQHEDKHASAHVVKSKSGINGIHCSTCSETFWPHSFSAGKTTDYDFYEIDRELHAIEFEEDPFNYLGEDAPIEYFSNEGRVVRSEQSRHLSPIALVDGVTLIRSPKGSGKTHQLRNIVAKCKDDKRSVLLIGHRQSLVSALCKDLGLQCYLDRKTPWGESIPVARQYGICLDSVPHHLDLKRNKYDVVIIDESEQVFSHLTSGTLKNRRRECFLMLQKYLARAKTVIACDADLSYLTLATISMARGDSMPTAFYINRYKEMHREIEIYDTENQLLGELLQSVRCGKKCYVCCNSKKQAKLIHEILQSQNSSLKIMLVTGENSASIESMKFVKNIKKDILLYDVVISSPTLGTGIDITFPDSEMKIDHVFGFFRSNINTHFDIDQQLCRVRHPQSVKVWISKERNFYETEPSVIKRNCVESGYIIDAQIGFDADDNKTYAEDDDLVSLFAEVISRQRASKNNLRGHFIDLKKFNGWSVVEVIGTNADSEIGAHAKKEAKKVVQKNEVDGICSAEKISTVKFKELLKEEYISPSQQFEIHRHVIEKFYGQSISPALVALDRDGKFRDQIKFLQLYLTSDDDLKQWDYRQSGHVLPDRDGFFRKKKLLREILHASTLTDEAGYFKNDKLICGNDLQEFTRVCVDREYEITSLLNIKPRLDIREKPIAYLKEFLELIGTGWAKRTQKDVNGKRTYYYRVDLDRFFSTYHFAKPRIDFSPVDSLVLWDDNEAAKKSIERFVKKRKLRRSKNDSDPPLDVAPHVPFSFSDINTDDVEI